MAGNLLLGGFVSLTFADGLAQAAVELRGRTGRWVVLIDGGSGSGKTCFGEGLAAGLGVRLVSLDDFYPGWDGLEAASAMVVKDVLHPRQPGYRSWDWENSVPAQWHALDPSASIVIEGCGALTAASKARSDLTIWLECPATQRKQRALDRDGQLFAAHWEQWEVEEREHWARDRPRSLADLVVYTGAA